MVLIMDNVDLIRSGSTAGMWSDAVGRIRGMKQG